jgi:hypothetical protein
MTKKDREVVEGEVLSEDSLEANRAYREYAQKPTDPALAGVWLLGLASLFFSFIPIFGLALAIIALVVCLAKKTPPILPIIAIIIGSITTSIFLLLWLLLKAIF